MLRGINRQTIFEDDEDRIKFLETLEKYKEISKFELYGYCLMDNHIHMLVKETEESISDVIKRVSSSYVHWYNMKYERVGHLFQERFKSENVETTLSFLRVLRYIHQNPLKAGLVKSIFDWKWTSMHEYVGTKKIVDIEKGFLFFHQDRDLSHHLFITFMMEDNDDQCLEYQVKTRMFDSQVREYLYSLGISNNGMLQQMGKADRDAILVQLKALKGVSIRQISRVTGISKSVIDRIR